MNGLKWLSARLVHMLHEASLAQHGGAPGVRDEGLLESALARPQNLSAYEGVDDAVRLAAAYGFGLARNHPFVDGNKRTAFLTAIVFLESNGFRFYASEEDAVITFLSLAAGEMSEDALAQWLRANSAPFPAERGA